MEDVTMDPAPASETGSRPPPPPFPEPEMGWVSWKEGEGPEPAKTERVILEEQRAQSQQHSLETLSAFGDSEVEVLGEIDLKPLGRELFLSHYLSPAATGPYLQVVGRVTNHLRLKGDLQDALTATIRCSSFRTEIDNQAYQASMAMKSQEIKRLHTRRQSNILVFKALDRLGEAGRQQHKLTKFVESVSFSIGVPGEQWTPTGWDPRGRFSLLGTSPTWGSSSQNRTFCRYQSLSLLALR